MEQRLKVNKQLPPTRMPDVIAMVCGEFTHCVRRCSTPGRSFSYHGYSRHEALLLYKVHTNICFFFLPSSGAWANGALHAEVITSRSLAVAAASLSASFNVCDDAGLQ